MRKIYIILLILSVCQFSFGQAKEKKSEDSLTFNMLKAPSSPAFTLMDLSNSNIEKPTEVTDFSVILNNATNGFTAIPKNFAMQFAPINLFKKEKYDFNQLTSNKVADNFNQSLLLSLGFSKSDSTKKTNNQLGIGIKFSLFRGGDFSKDFKRELSFRYYRSRKALKSLSQEALADSSNIILWSKKILQLGEEDEEKNKDKIDSLIDLREKLIAKLVEKNRTKTDSLSNLKKDYNANKQNFKKLSEISFKRYGWKADIAGGIVYDFLNERFDSSKVSKAGIWINWGYEAKSDFSILSVLRYLIEYDFKTLKNLSSLDIGVRIVQSGLIEDKLSLSLEHIWRSQIDGEVGKAKKTVRYIFNVEYQVSKNQLLTLSLGKNFDGTNIKDGNLVAALNFVAGFGAKR